MKNPIFLFSTILFCAMLTTTVSAQENKGHKGGPFDITYIYKPGDWYSTADPDSCLPCKRGFYPIYSQKMLAKGVYKRVGCMKWGKAKPKSVEQDSVRVQPIPTDTTKAKCDCPGSTTTTIQDNSQHFTDNSKHYFIIADMKKKSAVLGTTKLSGFVEGLGTFPTNREFKAFVPELKFGIQTVSYFSALPGLQLNLRTGFTMIPGAFLIKESCPNCVPQTGKGIFGLDAYAGFKWLISDRLTFEGGCYATKSWLPFKREVKELPADGWNGRLVFGKSDGFAKVFIGGGGKKGHGFTGYLGFLGEGIFEKQETRKILNPNRLK